jgi:hypothetical protein
LIEELSNAAAFDADDDDIATVRTRGVTDKVRRDNLGVVAVERDPAGFGEMERREPAGVDTAEWDGPEIVRRDEAGVVAVEREPAGFGEMERFELAGVDTAEWDGPEIVRRDEAGVVAVEREPAGVVEMVRRAVVGVTGLESDFAWEFLRALIAAGAAEGEEEVEGTMILIGIAEEEGLVDCVGVGSGDVEVDAFSVSFCVEEIQVEASLSVEPGVAAVTVVKVIVAVVEAVDADIIEVLFKFSTCAYVSNIVCEFPVIC